MGLPQPAMQMMYLLATCYFQSRHPSWRRVLRFPPQLLLLKAECHKFDIQMVRSTLLLSGIRGGPSFPMLQRNPQALDHHLSHESQLTGRGQHMPEEGHSDIAGIQSVASICTRSVIRPSLKYTAWPACPPEVSSRHCEIHKLREFMEHLMMICGFYCLQKGLGS